MFSPQTMKTCTSQICQRYRVLAGFGTSWRLMNTLEQLPDGQVQKNLQQEEQFSRHCGTLPQLVCSPPPCAARAQWLKETDWLFEHCEGLFTLHSGCCVRQRTLEEQKLREHPAFCFAVHQGVSTPETNAFIFFLPMGVADNRVPWCEKAFTRGMSHLYTETEGAQHTHDCKSMVEFSRHRQMSVSAWTRL